MADTLNAIAKLREKALVTARVWESVLEQIPHVEVFPYDRTQHAVLSGCFPRDLVEMRGNKEGVLDMTAFFDFFTDDKAQMGLSRNGKVEEMLVEGTWEDVLMGIVSYVSEHLMYPDPAEILASMSSALGGKTA